MSFCPLCRIPLPSWISLICFYLCENLQIYESTWFWNLHILAKSVCCVVSRHIRFLTGGCFFPILALLRKGYPHQWCLHWLQRVWDPEFLCLKPADVAIAMAMFLSFDKFEIVIEVNTLYINIYIVIILIIYRERNIFIIQTRRYYINQKRGGRITQRIKSCYKNTLRPHKNVKNTIVFILSNLSNSPSPSGQPKLQNSKVTIW